MKIQWVSCVMYMEFMSCKPALTAILIFLGLQLSNHDIHSLLTRAGKEQFLILDKLLESEIRACDVVVCT